MPINDTMAQIEQLLLDLAPSSAIYEDCIELITELAIYIRDLTEEPPTALTSCGLSWSDILIAAFHYCSEYHLGQTSPEYALMSIIGVFYRPPHAEWNATGDEKAVYDSLCHMAKVREL